MTELVVRDCKLIPLLIALMAIGCGHHLAADEQIVLRFRQSPVCNSHIVRLNDLIEVLSNSKEFDKELLQLVLAPAPRDGEGQSWSSNQIIEHLSLRGIHSKAIRWSGANSVVITRPTPADSALRMTPMSPAFVHDRTINQAESVVAQAINEYISLKSGTNITRRITARIPAQYATKLQVKRSIVGIGGGQDPWEGTQEFVLQVTDRGEQIHIPVEASIALAPMVVVASRPLRQDEILSADSLAYSALPERQQADAANYFEEIQQLVGQQLRKSVATGVPINKQIIGDPIVVSRGELLEIESISGSITVRTTGRSLGAGAIGESILVEVIPNRKKLTAIVAGPQRVRIAAMPDRSQGSEDQIVMDE